MAIQKPPTWTLKLNTYDLPIDLHILQNGEEIKALRILWRRQQHINQLIKHIDTAIANKIPTDTQRTSETKEVAVSRLHLTYKLKEDENPLDFTWESPKPTMPTHTTTDTTWWINYIAEQYERIAYEAADSIYVANQLDRQLRTMAAVPPDVKHYSIQTIYGLKGWLIDAGPHRTVTLNYVTFTP